jgi:membrane-bound serine protease (ClpP class)
MLFEAPIPDMRVSLGVVVPTALMVAGVTVFLLSRVIRAHRKQVLTGVEGLVGEVGKALSELAPEGKVLVHGEYWDARSKGAAIEAGTAVRVLAVGHRRIDVEPADEGSE